MGAIISYVYTYAHRLCIFHRLFIHLSITPCLQSARHLPSYTICIHGSMFPSSFSNLSSMHPDNFPGFMFNPQSQSNINGYWTDGEMRSGKVWKATISGSVFTWYSGNTQACEYNEATRTFVLYSDHGNGRSIHCTAKVAGRPGSLKMAWSDGETWTRLSENAAKKVDCAV